MILLVVIAGEGFITLAKIIVISAIALSKVTALLIVKLLPFLVDINSVIDIESIIKVFSYIGLDLKSKSLGNFTVILLPAVTSSVSQRVFVSKGEYLRESSSVYSVKVLIVV
jgi:hypothetical protein